MERAELTRFLDRLPACQAVGDVRILHDPALPAEAHLAGTRLAENLSKEAPPLGWFLVATGGSGGRAKWARHDEQTLAAAVSGFRQYFELEQVSCVDVLPAFHVSGLMARIRSWFTGGVHVSVPWAQLASGNMPTLEPKPKGWVISLVPTQLERLLATPAGVSFLRSFRYVFLGGAPAWSSLLARARDAALPITPCYGATETAAMVTALKPADFLAGAAGVGNPLPHAAVRLDDAGRVLVDSTSLFRGYAGEPARVDPWATSDLGEIDAMGCLRILGRTDDVLITGGKKVGAQYLEERLRTLYPLADVAVLGIPDDHWGERIVACVPPGALPTAKAIQTIDQGLLPHERPKAWREVMPWPRRPNGKLDRAALRRFFGPGR